MKYVIMMFTILVANSWMLTSLSCAQSGAGTNHTAIVNASAMADSPAISINEDIPLPESGPGLSATDRLTLVIFNIINSPEYQYPWGDQQPPYYLFPFDRMNEIQLGLNLPAIERVHCYLSEPHEENLPVFRDQKGLPQRGMNLIPGDKVFMEVHSKLEGKDNYKKNNFAYVVYGDKKLFTDAGLAVSNSGEGGKYKVTIFDLKRSEQVGLSQQEIESVLTRVYIKEGQYRKTMQAIYAKMSPADRKDRQAAYVRIQEKIRKQATIEFTRK